MVDKYEGEEQNGTFAGTASRVIRSVAESPYHFIVYFFVAAIMLGAQWLSLRAVEEAHTSLRQCMGITMLPSNETPK